MMQLKLKKNNGICLPPPINQSIPALASSILPQSSSDLYKDQGDITDKTIKQVVHAVNQMLLKTTTDNSTNPLTSSDSSHDRTPYRQSVPSLNPTDIHTQTKTPQTHTYRPDLPVNNTTHPVTNFKQTKQIIMDIDTLSHSPTLCNKILQELNLNWLFLYNNTHQAYLYEKFKPNS